MAQHVPGELDTNTGIPNESYPLLAPERIGELAERVLVLSEDINGPSQFSTEAAAYGYIERHWRVIVPVTLRANIAQLNRNSYTNNPMPENSINPVQNLAIMYWNFVRMVNGGVNRDHAFFIAAYRARLIYLGYLFPDKTTRAVTIDEVDFTERAADFHSVEAILPCRARAAVGQEGAPGYIPAQEAVQGNEYGIAYARARNDSQRIQAYYDHGVDEKFKRFISYALNDDNATILKHITFSAQQYAAMTYLVFRQHGHHYKTEFDAKYNVLWRATTIESPTRFPGNELIHRNAIHSFGMKTLHLKFFQNIDNNKLAETFVDRKDVAPAGTAVVATCHAAVELMRALPIWNQMYAAYKVQIDELAIQANKLKDAKDAIKYHKNARLFGVQKFTLNAEIAQSLAPIAKGFIESLGPEADLSRQKALDKRAQQNPLIASLVESVINKVTRSIARSGDISAFTQKIEPAKEAPKATSGAIEAQEVVVATEGTEESEESDESGEE